MRFPRHCIQVFALKDLEEEAEEDITRLQSFRIGNTPIEDEQL